MSTTQIPAPPRAPSLASSATFRTFALVFAHRDADHLRGLRDAELAAVHLSSGNRPGRLVYAAAVRDEGPAMYWYGWIATTLIGSAVLGILATMLPENMSRRIPLSLTWIVPVAAVPILIYALKFFWRW